MDWNDIFEIFMAIGGVAMVVLLVEFAVMFPLMTLHII